jgi:phosphoglycerate dehydrogenase-like enzyme
MTSADSRTTIAVLDDYQGVALQMADWSSLGERAEVTVFREPLSDPDRVVQTLAPFEVVCVMRERTPLPASVLERLPRLRLIVSTGPRNRSIDTEAARRLGVAVANTGYSSTPTIEFTWALILASARHIAIENAALRNGQWQQRVGNELKGRTLGVLGLGNIGAQVAAIGAAFGMRVIAWSENLTRESASAAGATWVSKDELFALSDIVTIHMVLSHRTVGLVSARELALMKPTAHLVNTSRGPIVVEDDLIAALTSGRIAAAALDVFAVEPLPADHPFRRLPNVLATPHLGYVSDALYRTFYGDTVENIRAWLEGRPLPGQDPA